MNRPVWTQDMFCCKRFLHISLLSELIFASVRNETSNLNLYRDRDFAFQKRVALRSYTAYFVCGDVEGTPGRECSCSVAMFILLWQGTINCCCPIWMELTFHPPRTPRNTTACSLREATQLGAGLRAASSKPCGTLQYWVMAWEFILNTASSGKGKVLATWMGASGTCEMWNHGH